MSGEFKGCVRPVFLLKNKVMLHIFNMLYFIDRPNLTFVAPSPLGTTSPELSQLAVREFSDHTAI